MPMHKSLRSSSIFVSTEIVARFNEEQIADMVTYAMKDVEEYGKDEGQFMIDDDFIVDYEVERDMDTEVHELKIY